MQSGARSRSLEVLWQAAGKVHDVGRAVPKPTEAAVHAAAAASRIGPYLLALFTSNTRASWMTTWTGLLVTNLRLTPQTMSDNISRVHLCSEQGDTCPSIGYV